MMPFSLHAQNITVKGTVSAADGPIIGATVKVKGAQGGVVTDFDGNYTISAQSNATLVFSYVGFETKEVKVGGKRQIDVTLVEDETLLNEVVVVGYGTMRKSDLTGAVTQVDNKAFEKSVSTSIDQVLQGRAAGVQIQANTGTPGGSSTIRIRGTNSLNASSQPIFVIDGVIIDSDGGDDGNSNPLAGINPSDILTMDILKDASATAIYGSRASNGVIMITTKRGKAGEATLTYDGYVGWSNAYKVPGMLNAQQLMQVVNETNFNTYGTATNWSNLLPSDILAKVNGGWKGTDWFKEYENKNALQFSHAVTLSGGSDRSKFSLSLNYSSNEGIMGGDNASSYKRYGGRINSEHVVLKGKDLLGDEHDLLTIGENVSYWYHKSHTLAESNGYWNIMQEAYIASPFVIPYNGDGSLASYAANHAGYSDMIYSQPLNRFLNGGFGSLGKDRDFGFGATVYWIVEPIKNLKYRGQFNTGYSASNYRQVGMPYSSSSTSASNSYTLSMNQSQSSSFTIENTLSYVLPQLGKHTIDVLVGQSFERSNWSTGMQMNFEVGAENLNSLVYNGWDYNIPSNYETKYMKGHSGYDNPRQGNIASFFGRINWNYDEKYMLTAILRTDGSSNFAKGKRWGTFPSVSAGWVITNEPFMAKSSKWLDFLKLRASWGQNGNCNIGNFYYLSNIAFSPTSYADYGYKFSSSMLNTVNRNSYQTGAYAQNAPNPDVTWETSEQ
ncbi:MAG: SusC/RagA family TonB-linked outer membrane protein, partial [Prevotella sp.]|nr:SusC/RagA family TonB-linked outer membrane protein [Prevotella sp.]